MGCVCSSEALGPMNPNEVDMSHFVMLKVVGRGGFGKVNAVEKRDSNSGELMAMKRIRKRLILEKDVYLDTVWRERNVMTLWKTDFLVKIRYAFQNADELFIVMPFMPGGDLRYYLQTKGPMIENVAKFYAAEMVLALEDLRNCSVVYRDLKPDNMLFDAKGHVAFSDFGLAILLDASNNFMTNGSAGTPGYLAPEVLLNEPYDFSVDMYSYGITLYELLMRRRPYATKRESLQGAKPEFAAGVSAEFKSLINGLLEKDPRRRLGCGPNGIAELKAHPFFAGVDWAKMAAREITPPFQPDVNRANCSADYELEDQFFASADEGLPPIPPEQQQFFNGFEFNVKISPAAPAGGSAAPAVQPQAQAPTGQEQQLQQHQASSPPAKADSSNGSNSANARDAGDGTKAEANSGEGGVSAGRVTKTASSDANPEESTSAGSPIGPHTTHDQPLTEASAARTAPSSAATHGVEEHGEAPGEGQGGAPQPEAVA